jgi:hypothetical protein
MIGTIGFDLKDLRGRVSKLQSSSFKVHPSPINLKRQGGGGDQWEGTTEDYKIYDEEMKGGSRPVGVCVKALSFRSSKSGP